MKTELKKEGSLNTLHKTAKTSLVLALALVLILCVGLLTGCGNEHSGRKIEVDGWTLFRFRQSGQVNILSANCTQLGIGGFMLTLPTTVGMSTSQPQCTYKMGVIM